MNLTKTHCKKYCGLLSKSLGLELRGRKMQLEKKSGKARNPKKSVQKLNLAFDYKHAAPKIMKHVGNYRPDLIPDVKKALRTLAKQDKKSISS